MSDFCAFVCCLLGITGNEIFKSNVQLWTWFSFQSSLCSLRAGSLSGDFRGIFPKTHKWASSQAMAPVIGLRIARAQELGGRGLRVLRVFYSRDLIQMIYELYKTKTATATIWLSEFAVGCVADTTPPRIKVLVMRGPAATLVKWILESFRWPGVNSSTVLFNAPPFFLKNVINTPGSA